MKKMNKKGFTLAELLIVVAIIAVLVAIAIPVFTAQLEKSKEATDAANIRSAYAEVITDALTTASSSTRTIDLKQSQDDWQGGQPDLAGSSAISGSGHVGVTINGTPKKDGTCTVTYTPASGSTAESVTISFSS